MSVNSSRESLTPRDVEDSESSKNGDESSRNGDSTSRNNDTESEREERDEDELEIKVDLLIPGFVINSTFEREEIEMEAKERLGINNEKIKLFKITKFKRKSFKDDHVAISIPKSKLTLSFIETLLKENKMLKEKLEKSSEALIAFHEKSSKDAETIEELKKKYKEEKKTRLSVQEKGRRKSIEETKQPVLSRASMGPRMRSHTLMELPKNELEQLKNAQRGSCRVCNCKGFKSMDNSSWLCVCGHINLKH